MTNNKTSIKNWKTDDQPREKLRDKGKSTLSDSELIAILLGSGSRDESAVQLAKRLLASANNSLSELAKYTISDLIKFKGVGEAKAVTIITAIELGLRMQSETVISKPKISSSRDVFSLLQPYISRIQHEEFWVIYLNNNNSVVSTMQLSKGGITGTVADIRMLFKKGIEVLATAIIVAHNHPSGKLTPSEADKNLTAKIKEAGNTLDIKLLDHVIVTDKNYLSFSDEGLL